MVRLGMGRKKVHPRLERDAVVAAVQAAGHDGGNSPGDTEGRTSGEGALFRAIGPRPRRGPALPEVLGGGPPRREHKGGVRSHNASAGGWHITSAGVPVRPGRVARLRRTCPADQSVQELPNASCASGGVAAAAVGSSPSPASLGRGRVCRSTRCRPTLRRHGQSHRARRGSPASPGSLAASGSAPMVADANDDAPKCQRQHEHRKHRLRRQYQHRHRHDR